VWHIDDGDLRTGSSTGRVFERFVRLDDARVIVDGGSAGSAPQ
jgi:hypothetical protein